MFAANPTSTNEIDDLKAFELLLEGNLVFNKTISSPYRKDKHPSFVVRRSTAGRIYFVDYATGDSGGWYKLYQLIHGGSYTQALRFFREGVSTIPTNTVIQNPIVSKKAFKPFRLDVKYIPWSTEMLYYWRQYNISYYTLIHYNVRCISAYKLKDYPIRYVRAYSYELENNERKILVPKGAKLNKWFTNSRRIQGQEQLDISNDIVIITKSLKDVMVLHELGYSAIAPQSESDLISSEYMKYLQTNFKTIFLLFDNDDAGRKGSAKYLEEYPFIKSRFINKHLGKDVSDVSKRLGLTKAFSLMRALTKE